MTSVSVISARGRLTSCCFTWRSVFLIWLSGQERLDGMDSFLYVIPWPLLPHMPFLVCVSPGPCWKMSPSRRISITYFSRPLAHYPTILHDITSLLRKVCLLMRACMRFQQTNKQTRPWSNATQLRAARVASKTFMTTSVPSLAISRLSHLTSQRSWKKTK